MNDNIEVTETSVAPAPESATMDVEEAARFIGISVSWLYRHWRQVPHIKLGRRVRFTRDGLQAWFKQQERVNAEAAR
ncbi:MAG: DNA-binding protein [Archangium gephyra]|uniref:DNA-binding protein n=1 Tax=Archangium gephyra TaxID=48 RepID=A0A2W5T6L3_9BACT|nr:MAG: DNA-binding protein [Archangium gephyra]